jgi:nucleoside-diphosphate-sugar epimerase
MQRHPVVHQLRAEEHEVLGVARKPVGRLADHQVDHAGLDIAQQLLQLRAVAAIAGLLRIVIGRHDRPAEILDQLHAGSRLSVLEVALCIAVE